MDCLLVVASLLVTNVSNQVLRPSGLTCTSRKKERGHAQLNGKPCKGLNDNDIQAALQKELQLLTNEGDDNDGE